MELKQRATKSAVFGSREEYPTESARKSPGVQAILLRLNADQPSTADPVTFGAVIARYEQEEMPERYSTKPPTSRTSATTSGRAGPTRHCLP